MSDRFFSENVQYQAVLSNLEQNNGQLKCAICGKNLVSKTECHFDHIIPYAKGGKSIFDNCQILCLDCNLSKSDKELQDFLLQEKAKKFMIGENICNNTSQEMHIISNTCTKITKEKFDKIVGEFIERKGSIKKVDFTREKNGLPSISYVIKFYGSMNELKLAFGLKPDIIWNRDNIWEYLVEYSSKNPEFKQADLVKHNNLPSLPCILSYYPEFKNFNDIKRALGLDLNYEFWTKEKVLVACNSYLESHKKITLKDLKKENGLPTSKVIYRLFGDMTNFQEQIGSEISKRQKFISKDEIISATKEIVRTYGNLFDSRSAFMDVFPYSMSSIIHRFGTFDFFIEQTDIKIINVKKAKYTRQEVDDCIIAYLKEGNPIPASAKQLSSLNLPSSSTILRFYENWREPFVVYSKMLIITNK